MDICSLRHIESDKVWFKALEEKRGCDVKVSEKNKNVGGKIEEETNEEKLGKKEVLEEKGRI